MSYELHQGDCLDVLRGLPDASVDAVVTDPPYGTASVTKVQKRGTNRLETFAITWDTQLPLEWVIPAARVLKPGGSLLAFTDTKAITTVWQALKHAGVNPLQCVYWHKTNPPPQPRKNFSSAVEALIFARKSGKVLWWAGGGATPNIIHAPLVGGRERAGHPTQKPVALMSHLCRLVIPPGGTVLDPFMGSASTGVAALQGGYSFIGIERDPDYIAIAERRLASAQLPLTASI